MAYFYVSTSAGKTGTRTTGGGDTARTGAFSAMADSDVYATIELAQADAAMVVGDFIYVASDHVFSTTAAINYGLATTSPIPVVSVDKDNCDQYLAGASEIISSGGNDFLINNDGAGSQIALFGVDLTVADNIQSSSSNCIFRYSDGTITFNDSTDAILNQQSGQYVCIENSTMVWTAGSTAKMFGWSNGARIDLKNVIFQNGSGTLDDMFDGAGGGGAYAYLDECDCSEVGGYILGATGAAMTVDDCFIVRMSDCKMNASKLFVEEEFVNPGMLFLATNCTDVSDEAEYQFFQRTSAGDVEDSGDDGSGIYRNESTAFTNSNKVSFKITTSSRCALGAPLVFDMPAVYADLTAAGSDAITVYFACPTATTLTDTNFWVEISYPDATNKQTWETVSSRNTDIIATGTTHTDDSGASTWKNGASDLASYNEYRLTVTSTTGAASVPRIRVFCTVASLTMYVCTTVGLS